MRGKAGWWGSERTRRDVRKVRSLDVCGSIESEYEVWE
jgi:hypothetical protein